MKELIRLLQVLRHSKICTDGVFRVSEEILFHHRYTPRGTRLFLQYKEYTMYLNSNMQLFSSNERITLLDGVPYNCEDKNEFFQLSTLHDYNDISYEDLVELRELCNFMITRDLNERKR